MRNPPVAQLPCAGLGRDADSAYDVIEPGQFALRGGGALAIERPRIFCIECLSMASHSDNCSPIEPLALYRRIDIDFAKHSADGSIGPARNTCRLDHWCS